MIVVAGTMRSGTSLWMHILSGSGLRYIGDRFPRDWGQRLRDANPNGFYESVFRQGVNFQTNPHPRTGNYLKPEQSRRLLVKVFPSGVARSDIAFLDRVVVTVRPWRSVVRSNRKMRQLEAEVWKWEENGRAPAYPLPEVDWIVQNFLMVRDLRLRGYPSTVHHHGTLMHSPTQTIRQVLDFLGQPVELAPKLAEAIDPRLNRSTVPSIRHSLADDAVVAGIDHWLACVEQGQWNDQQGLEGLEEAWKYVHREKLVQEKYHYDHPKLTGEAPS